MFKFIKADMITVRGPFITESERHDFYQIDLILEDPVMFIINNHQKFTLKKGDLIMIKPGVLHSIICEEKMMYNNINVKFQMDAAVFDGFFSFTDSAVFGMHNGEHCLKLFNSIIKDFYFDHLRNQQQAQKNVLLLLDFIKQDQMTQCKIPDKKQQIIELVRYEIENHKEYNLNVLLQQSGLPRTLFFKFFRLYTGTSPKNYIMQIKINSAKQLLLGEKHLTIKEISKICAFNDEFQFSKIFRKYAGLSPAQYRNP
ncbi:MAG: hypothetical protein A2096_01320 [Spirochaetes bacterium GWF1_41_5]|nr:MAG: hypothetical protein A2096_01320 [Spirochaetes bacterium GWF1_41_5]